MAQPITIAPSILSADFARLAEEIAAAVKFVKSLLPEPMTVPESVPAAPASNGDPCASSA